MIAGRPMAAGRERELRTNVLLLFAAFAIGQGSLFLAQTWLVLAGQLEFVGRFGLPFSFAVLAFYIVDWGGLVLLARSELEARGGGDANTLFWSFSCARLLIAGMVAGLLLTAVALVGDEFSGPYIWAVIPGLLVFAFNAGGVLDGLHRSGWAGLTTMLPMLASAIALPLAFLSPLEVRGPILGGAYTLGAIVAVLAQHALVSYFGRSLGRPNVDRPHVRLGLIDGWLILMAQIPGQFLYRLQLSIAAWLLGPAATGIVVYAKQISSAALQGVQFVRRAEFPRLMESLRTVGTLRNALRIQRQGIALGAVIGTSLSIGGALIWYARSDELAEAAALAAAFGPVVLTGAIYGALTQVFLGAKRFKISAVVGNTVVLIGYGLTILLVPQLGVVGIPIAELLVHAAGAISLLWIWKGKRLGVEPNELRRGGIGEPLG